jgi:hypothetical protein
VSNTLDARHMLKVPANRTIDTAAETIGTSRV